MSSHRSVTIRSNYGYLAELCHYLVSAIVTFQNCHSDCFIFRDTGLFKALFPQLCLEAIESMKDYKNFHYEQQLVFCIYIETNFLP